VTANRQESFTESTPRVIVLPASPAADDESVNLGDIGSAIWRGRWWILLLVVVCAVLAGTRASLAPPI
jgi:uncharacterized protein involved in exopolysaccharide biosynthesis